MVELSVLLLLFCALLQVSAGSADLNVQRELNTVRSLISDLESDALEREQMTVMGGFDDASAATQLPTTALAPSSPPVADAAAEQAAAEVPEVPVPSTTSVASAAEQQVVPQPTVDDKQQKLMDEQMDQQKAQPAAVDAAVAAAAESVQAVEQKQLPTKSAAQQEQKSFRVQVEQVAQEVLSDVRVRKLAEAKVAVMVSQAEQQATEIRQKARDEAKSMMDKAKADADAVLDQARKQLTKQRSTADALAEMQLKAAKEAALPQQRVDITLTGDQQRQGDESVVEAEGQQVQQGIQDTAHQAQGDTE